MAGDFIQRSRHGTVFYFRRRVPLQLRTRLGRLHFYASLHTEQLAEAKCRARAMAVVTDRLFTELTYVQGNDDDKTSQINFGLFIDWDAESGKPRVNASDVKPGEEKAVTDLARMLLDVVNEVPAQLKPTTPARKAITPTVNEAIAAKLRR